MKLEPSTDPRTGRLYSVYVRLTEGVVARTEAVESAADPAMLLDLDGAGRIVGIEVVSADILRQFCEGIAQRLPTPYQQQVRELSEA